MRHRVAVWTALVLVLALAVTGAAHARALSLYVGCGLQYLGSWTWNENTSSTVQVKVRNLSYRSAPVLVEVKAQATDGSTVQGSVTLFLGGHQGRMVSVPLPKPVVQLQFIQIRQIGGPSLCCPQKPGDDVRPY